MKKFLLLPLSLFLLNPIFAEETVSDAGSEEVSLVSGEIAGKDAQAINENRKKTQQNTTQVEEPQAVAKSDEVAKKDSSDNKGGSKGKNKDEHRRQERQETKTKTKTNTKTNTKTKIRTKTRMNTRAITGIKTRVNSLRVQSRATKSPSALQTLPEFAMSLIPSTFPRSHSARGSSPF